MDNENEKGRPQKLKEENLNENGSNLERSPQMENENQCEEIEVIEPKNHSAAEDEGLVDDFDKVDNEYLVRLMNKPGIVES